MWLFTKNSFVSVVSHREQPENVLVRARVKKHLSRLFPDKAQQIFADETADYKYRLIVGKKELAETVAQYVLRQLDYDNFKAAQEHDPAWMRFLHKIWGEGYQLQK